MSRELVLCRWCTGYLFTTSTGMAVHLDGGGIVWRRCHGQLGACGWSGSDAVVLIDDEGSTAVCPRCGSTALQVDHAAEVHA